MIVNLDARNGVIEKWGKNMDKDQKRQLYKLGLPIILGTILLLGVSYAWFTLTLSGTKNNTIYTGNLALILSDEMSDGLLMEDAIPVPDAVGERSTAYTFTVENVGNLNSNYTVYLDNLSLESGESLLQDKFIKYQLTKNGQVISQDLLSSTGSHPNRILDGGFLTPGSKNTYELKLWLDYDATGEAMNKVFRGQIRVVGEQVVTGPLTTKLVSAIGENGSVDTSTVANTSLIKGIDPNNYVWYSGYLWRVVSIDGSGNIRMIIDEPITQWKFGNDVSWGGSIINNYLNDYFYDHLDTSLITSSTVCLDPATSDTSARTICSSHDTVMVGLLSLDEFNLIGRNSYLQAKGSEYYYYLSNPDASNPTSMIYAAGKNAATAVLQDATTGPTFAYRPVITLKSGVKTITGNGTINNPYRLEGDDVGTKDSNLSDRHSGEYIMYDNKLFRIVEQTSQGTKVLYSGSEILYSGPFNSDELDSGYNYSMTNGVGQAMQNVIQDRSKVVENVVWYRNGYDETMTPQQSTLLDTGENVTTTVGLIRVGELFSFFSSDSWTMTWGFAVSTNDIFEFNPWMYNLNASPVIFLKSNSTITGGDGTSSNPYTLS